MNHELICKIVIGVAVAAGVTGGAAVVREVEKAAVEHEQHCPPCPTLAGSPEQHAAENAEPLVLFAGDEDGELNHSAGW